MRSKFYFTLTQLNYSGIYYLADLLQPELLLLAAPFVTKYLTCHKLAEVF